MEHVAFGVGLFIGNVIAYATLSFFTKKLEWWYGLPIGVIAAAIGVPLHIAFS